MGKMKELDLDMALNCCLAGKDGYECKCVAIQKVKDLHFPVPDPIAQRPDSFICGHCSDVEMGFYMIYPCPTIEALDGEQ